MNGEPDLVCVGGSAVWVLIDLRKTPIAGTENLVLIGIVWNTEQCERTASPGFITEEQRDKRPT